MQFYRLVKPVWAQPTLANGEPNPKFVEALDGPNTYEAAGYTQEFLQQKNAQGYNCYFFPNHPSTDVYAAGTKYLNGRNIDVFNYVFVDMDLKDGKYASKDDFLQKLRGFPLKPSMVVDSGNGVHAYWRISDLDRSMYTITQLALIKHFQTDESIWTVLQLMRVPGLMNTKRHKDYVPCAILEAESCGETYSIKQFPKTIYELDEKTVLKATNHINRLEGKMEIDLGKEVNGDELPDVFVQLMLENQEIARLFHDPKSHGDRSSADMKLANILFNRGLNIREAHAVISNTQKALEKGPHRKEYATMTVGKVYSDRPKHRHMTVSEYMRDQGSKIMEPQIFGPHYLDYEVLGEPWRRKELLGVIAGPGIGKTAFALNIIRDIITNNPHNDDVYVFFSLEMSKGQVIKRWLKLVGENSPLADRLYVIDTQDEKGMPSPIGLQEMYFTCVEIKQATGKHVGAFVADHFHIISSHINIHKKPNFGIKSEQNTGYGDIQNLSANGLATQLKSLVKTLDTLGIILTQTTKEKGVGDLPIGKDGAYGVSQYEWIMDRIVTIWQPLMRVQNLTKNSFLAFQYAKMREKHPKDKIKELDPKLLTYDMGSGNLRVTTSNEYEEFVTLLPQANEARDNLVKKKANAYSIQLNLTGIEEALKKVGVRAEPKV
jgi:hypothetical protein